MLKGTTKGTIKGTTNPTISPIINLRTTRSPPIILNLRTTRSPPIILNLPTNVTENRNLSVAGHLSKGSGTFAIDHPLDPENKILYHSFVESPDVKNLYDGIATLDENGEATILLPEYFDALNKDVRYQMKGITAAMPNLYIKQEVAGGTFVIAGGSSGGRVSWQVTGIRQDPYIKANPIVPEVEKGPDQLYDKGQYIHPQVRPAFPTRELVEMMRTLFGAR